MAYTFTLTATLAAAPQDIYEAWLDSIAHSAMTGGEAKMSTELGAEVSAWDGYITGRNLELVPGERIVQSWRTSEFDAEDEDSIVTIVLQEIDDGTLLTLQHSNVPDAHRSYEEGGWQSNYFEPMTVYFVQRESAGEREERLPRKVAARTPTPRRPAKSAPASRRKASRAKRNEKAQKKAKAVRKAAATVKRAKQRPKAGRGKRSRAQGSNQLRRGRRR
jgi:uncharacterized protein YndB with AHSA1/START domain